MKKLIFYYLIIFFISMVPIVELRGAIPYAVTLNETLKNSGDPQMNMILVYIIAIIGNIIPVPFIFFFARRILEWGKDKKVIGKFCSWCLRKGEKGGQKLQAKAKHGQYVALLLFVGIPLPGTGAWTGTLAASFLDMDFKKSVFSIIGGVLLAGIIMFMGSYGVVGGIHLFN
jgi:uncharacterized membrane protein